MNPLLTSINLLAGSVLASELNSYWLAIAVAAAAWVALKFAPRMNAATRHAIWWVVLAIVLVLPFAPRVSLRRSQPARVHAPTAAPAAQQLILIDEPAAVTVPAQRVGFWPLAGLTLWAALLVFRLAQIAQSWKFLRGVIRRASISSRPLTFPRRAQLLLSSEIASPIAVGFLRPAVILPASLPKQLSESELDHVLLHEAAHIARYDDWTNLAARIAGAALALHPAALWILRQIERQREAACDDFVVARTGQAHPYARSLAKLFELRWTRRADLLAAGIFGRSSRLGDRIEALLRAGRKFSARASVASLAAGTAALLALAAAGSLAPRWVAFAQQPRLEFEVATVKPAAPPSQPGRFLVGISGGPGTNDPGRIVYTNLPLKTIITNAYDIRPYQLTGPSWLDSERFDVTAKVPEGATREQARLMMQSLLADRFKMTLHHETKELPIYEMTVARGGIKMKPEAEDPNAPKGPPPAFGRGGPPAPPPMDKNGFPQLPAGRRGMLINMGPGRMRMTSSVQSITDLANMLSNQLGMPVVDKTGLTGTYTYTLEFAPEPGQYGPLGLPPPPLPAGAEPGGGLAGRGGPVADTPSDVPNVFTAIQEQLGLKLDRKRGPVDTLVIDRIERAPTEN